MDPKFIDIELEKILQDSPRSEAAWTKYVSRIVDEPNVPTLFKLELFQRALTALPTSIELWRTYLDFRVHKICAMRPLDDKCFARTTEAFETCLNKCLQNSMEMWLKYLNFVCVVCGISDERLVKVVDSCLQSTSVSDHSDLWDFVLNDSTMHASLKAELLTKRYLKFAPNELPNVLESLAPEERFKASLEFEGNEVAEDIAMETLLDFPSCTRDSDAVERVFNECRRRDPAKAYVAKAKFLLKSLKQKDQAYEIFEQSLQPSQEEKLTMKRFRFAFESYACVLEKNNDSKKLEELLAKRKRFISDVGLRLWPHDVELWKTALKESSNPSKTFESAVEALQVEDEPARGEVDEIWLAYAAIADDFSAVFERGLVECSYKKNLYLAYINRLSDDDSKLKVARRAISEVNSQEIFEIYLGLETRVGKLISAKAAFKQALEDFKIATPIIVLKFALMLDDSDAFKAFEMGLRAFKGCYPLRLELQLAYLKRAVSSTLPTEQIRAIFEAQLRSCPVEFSFLIYVEFAAFERKISAKRALGVCDRAVDAIPSEHRKLLPMFVWYADLAERTFGGPAARSVYARGVEALPDRASLELLRKFISLEVSLGEHERARRLYEYGSQLADPRSRDSSFYSTWKEFELEHGDEETYKDMLRLSKAAEEKFSLAQGGKWVAIVEEEHDDEYDEHPKLDEIEAILNAA